MSFRYQISTAVALSALLVARIPARQGPEPTQGRGGRAPIAAPAQDNPTAGPTMTKEDFAQLMQRLSNWGRWGQSDQKGSLNLITASKRRTAARLVKDGVSVSLAHSPITEKAVDTPNPFELTMLGRPGLGVAADSWRVSHHGFAFTHVDALCHFPFDGKNFNGYTLSETTAAGCAKDDVTQMRDGVLTRGILIDIPRLRQVPYLDAPAAIKREDVEAWLKKAHIHLEPGDAVLFRTGRWAQRAAQGPTNLQRTSPGVHVSVLTLLKDTDIAFAGSDVGIDVAPSGVEGQGNPIHTALLAVMGVPLLDNADLERLAELAARLNRWDFMFSLEAVPVVGGTGGLVNPIATF